MGNVTIGSWLRPALVAGACALLIGSSASMAGAVADHTVQANTSSAPAEVQPGIVEDYQ
ncbi:hypothetical protein [Amycolatopsis cihanbeyliensis]|uniref:hypothetical protein n=1 Tax=Amycolatopsis cihanbeyliensis TaxID=1128664 RepID=UPI0014775B4A|nr:hypothetical protein [Amycolatopsis cihanbeyliensis]